MHTCSKCNKNFSSGVALGGHRTHCLGNRTERTSKKKPYIVNCKKCDTEFTVVLSKKGYTSGKYRKHCTRSCANSREQTLEIRKSKSSKQIENYKDPKCRRVMSIRQKGRWKNAIYRDSQIKAIMDGSKLLPNKPEKLLNKLLDRLFPNDYKYVGDGQFIIAGKCPDFININGQKKIIELFGDYWHKDDDPQDRVDIFSPYGYKTLVVWEHELKDTSRLKDSLLEFHNGCVAQLVRVPDCRSGCCGFESHRSRSQIRLSQGREVVIPLCS